MARGAGEDADACSDALRDAIASLLARDDADDADGSAAPPPLALRAGREGWDRAAAADGASGADEPTTAATFDDAFGAWRRYGALLRKVRVHSSSRVEQKPWRRLAAPHAFLQ